MQKNDDSTLIVLNTKFQSAIKTGNLVDFAQDIQEKYDTSSCQFHFIAMLFTALLVLVVSNFGNHHIFYWEPAGIFIAVWTVIYVVRLLVTGRFLYRDFIKEQYDLLISSPRNSEAFRNALMLFQLLIAFHSEVSPYVARASNYLRLTQKVL